MGGVRLRFARHGLRNKPLFHIVAISHDKSRNARPLEKLGEYDPIPKIRDSSFIPPENRVFGSHHTPAQLEKRIEWNVERIKWWIGNGALPTNSVAKLLQRGGILPPGHPLAATRKANAQILGNVDDAKLKKTSATPQSEASVRRRSTNEEESREAGSVEVPLLAEATIASDVAASAAAT